MAGQVNIVINYVSPGGNQQASPPTVPIATPLGAVTVITFANGFQAVAVPTGATYVLIIPNLANTVALTLKGITGDTGVHLSPTLPTLLALDPNNYPATLGFTAGNVFTTPTQIVFI